MSYYRSLMMAFCMRFIIVRSSGCLLFRRCIYLNFTGEGKNEKKLFIIIHTFIMFGTNTAHNCAQKYFPPRRTCGCHTDVVGRLFSWKYLWDYPALTFARTLLELKSFPHRSAEERHRKRMLSC